jgi:manganese transport protein
LWVLCEVAICATDLAEVIGTAIALNLLFGIPLTLAVILTALDALLLLWLQHWGFRKLEAFIITLMTVIAFCYAYNLALAQPDLAAVLAGYFPASQIVGDPGMLYIAIGILGATVMPHNLYLHSSIVQTRQFEETESGKREAIRFATIDSTVALLFALFVNSAILVLAAAVFHAGGRTEVAEIQEAYQLLAPLLGTAYASLAFGVALLACGLNSTVTATLSGQIVMEGFLELRLPPVMRRLMTRMIAVVPGIIAAALYGESGTAQLLILSQVILSLQLPFAVVPLMLFVGDRRAMGAFAIPPWAKLVGWAMAALIVALNAKLLFDVLAGG